MSPNDMQAAAKVYLAQQGYLVLTPDQCRSLLQEAHERGKASNTNVRTFSQDNQPSTPSKYRVYTDLIRRGTRFTSADYSPEHMAANVHEREHGWPGWAHHLYSCTAKEFADRSHLRRVQITDKNGKKTWVWKRQDEQDKQNDKAAPTPEAPQAAPSQGATPTAHPLNRASPSADYHPTAVAEQAVANAFQNPAAMNPSHIEHIAEHLDVLQVGKLKQMAKEVRLRIGGRKAALVDRLIQHLQYLHSQGQGQGQGQQPPQVAEQGPQEPAITPTTTPGPAPQAQPAPTPPQDPPPPPPPDPALDMGNLDTDASIRGTASTPRGRNPDEAKDRHNVTQGEHGRAAKEWQAKNGPPPGSTLTPRQRWQALAKRRGELAEQEKTARQRGSVVRKIPSLQPLANAYKNSSPQLKEITDSLMYNLSGVANADKIARQLTTAWNDGERLGLKPEESSIIDNAMSQAGLSKQGEPGETARFNGAYMEGPAGLFTGDQVKILRPAVIMRRADGGEYVVQRGQVEKWNA